MIEKTFDTPSGQIHYWRSEPLDEHALTLVFLPGLTADHRLFDRQIPFFEGRMNVLTWDAPGHALSRPFTLDFNLFDKARWLSAILEKECIRRPLIVGQSMGGYVGQAFAQLFPDRLCGFVSIDSAPLQRRFASATDLWLMKHIEPVYRMYPWKILVKAGAKGVATSEYGRSLMRDMMLDYGNKSDYASLVGHGYRILAEAIEADLPYELKCPALLICGDKDRAGTTKRYNKVWHTATGIPIQWIPGAGHNSNTDAPERVNGLIDNFLSRYERF